MEIKRNSVFLSLNGGVVDIVDQSGVLAAISIPAGRVPALDYFDLIPDGAWLEVVSGLAVLEPRLGYGVQKYGDGSHDTGANPDFAPTSASRMEMQMRLTLAQMQASTARLEARERALASIERIPTAPPQDPVIEAPLDE
jgi:hypothetical protein